jgi:phytoene desaturase
MRVVVIGAGFGGLAAAIRLRSRGHEVEIVEKREQAGGRAGVFRQDGFTFDAGPTIITAPQLLEELFDLAGRRLADYVQLVPVDPFYRVRFHDGTSIDWSSCEAERERAIAALSPADVAGYRRFAKQARDVFEHAFPLIDHSLDRLGTMAQAAPALVRSRAWKSVASVVEANVTDPRIRQVLSFHPLLIGGNPYDSPSIYALIHELEKRWGVWFAMGGTSSSAASPRSRKVRRSQATRPGRCSSPGSTSTGRSTRRSCPATRATSGTQGSCASVPSRAARSFDSSC